MQGVTSENIYSQVRLPQSTRGRAQRTGEARANKETIYARIKSPPALPLREDYIRMQSPVFCSSPQEQYADVQSPPSFATREEKARSQTQTPRINREESICMQTPTHRIHRHEYTRMHPSTPRNHRNEHTRIEPPTPHTHRNEQTRMHPPTPRTPRTPLDEYANMQVRFPFTDDVEYTCMHSPLSNSGRDDQSRVDTLDDSEIELGGSAATILGTGERNSKVLDDVSLARNEVGNCALRGGSLHRTNPSSSCNPTFTVTRSDTIPRGAVKTPINAAIEHLGALGKLQLSR